MREFDTFSFRPGSRDSERSSRDSERQLPPPKNWKEMSYRFQRLKNNHRESKEPNRPTSKQLVYENHYINDKISRVQEEMSQNIRRRIELEKKLYLRQQEQREERNKRIQEPDQKFIQIEKKSEDIDRLVSRFGDQRDASELQRTQVRSQVQSQVQGQAKWEKIQQRDKKVLKDQVRLQGLLKKITFPQLPKVPLERLQKEVKEISLLSSHSDITYLNMVVSFHLGLHNRVRRYFREILTFKVYQPKAIWVACESEFELEGYDVCIKLADLCMKQLADEHLPRFLFLQARSYDQLGNFVNSIVCYNQLIKLRPNVGEFRLERALLYDKMGYPEEAKLDYWSLGAICSSVEEYLREKILAEASQTKRKQLIRALAKVVG